MKLELTRNEISTLLNILSPFSCPDSWDDEKLDILLIRIKRQLAETYYCGLNNKTEILFPNEWNIEFLKNYILSNDHKTILVIQEPPFAISALIVNWASSIEYGVVTTRVNYIEFKNGNVVLFGSREDAGRGLAIDILLI